MKTNTKNYILYCILSNNSELKEAMDKETNFYSLNSDQLSELSNLAEISNVKPRYGWSKARTIYYRAIEGRPF